MSWFDTLLWPLMWVVAWIMYLFHKGLTFLGLESGAGLTWALSIIGLVITIRILLIPLFVKQINAARGMQMLSPELQALQKKYKGKSDPASREAMTRETMELYKKHGTNPFSSCLPLLAQSPIFFALFRVLSNLGALADGTFQGGKSSIGPLTQELASQANDATIFGAEISSRFIVAGATTQTKVVAVALIILMSVTTFTTQKQLTQKNMPAAALHGPMAQQQKMLMYILPVVFALSGVSFPLGVLIYWSTTNFWSMGQQFYVIRRNPTPGSEADRLLKERRARKAAARGIVLEEEPTSAVDPEKPKGQRQQPVRKDRARPRPTGTSGGAASGAAGGSGGTGSTSARKSAASGPAAGKTSSGSTRSGAAGRSGTSEATPASGRGATSGKTTPSGSGGAAASKKGAGSPATGRTRPTTPGARARGTQGLKPLEDESTSQATTPGASGTGARTPGSTGKRSAGGAPKRGTGRAEPAPDAPVKDAAAGASEQDEAGVANPQDEQ